MMVCDLLGFQQPTLHTKSDPSLNPLSVMNTVCAGMVDTIFADVAQPDQARIVAINAHHFLKNQGHVVISIKVRFLFLDANYSPPCSSPFYSRPFFFFFFLLQFAIWASENY